MSNERAIADARSEAIKEHVARHTVSLVFSDGTPASDIATGTCVTIGGRHFIATAAHNFDDVDDKGIRRIGVFPADTRLHKYQHSPPIIGWGRKGGEVHDPVDVGWLELEPRAIPDFVGDFGRRTFATFERVSLSAPARDTKVFVIGTPSENVTRTETARGPDVVADGLPLETYVIEPPSDASRAHDLYVAYKTKMQTCEGLKPTPRAQGMSGTGIWALDVSPGAIWSADSARLVAVQRTYVAGEYLRGTLIRDWLTMMRDQIPELAVWIDPFLGEHAT